MALPYIVHGTITDTDATNPNGAKVTLRNNTNGETTTNTTNSSGQYSVDAANLTSGYLQTDRLTIHCAWGLAEADNDFLISDEAGGHTVDLTLVAVADSDDVSYCTIQDVLDELGDKTTSDISYARIRKAILRAESEIEEHTGSAWKSVTITEEIYDFNQYTGYKSAEQLRYVGTVNRFDYWNQIYDDTIKLTHRPIVSITSLYKNDGSAIGTDEWTELIEQEGSEGDFLKYGNEGLIKFMKNRPRYGKRSIKITYVYGHTKVPRVVERLTLLMTIRDIIRSKASGSQFSSQESISVEGMSVQAAGSSGTIIYLQNINKEIDRCWNKVGSFSSQVA